MNTLDFAVLVGGFLVFYAVGRALGYKRGRQDGIRIAIRNRTHNVVVGEMLGRFADEADAETRKRWAMGWVSSHCEEFKKVAP